MRIELPHERALSWNKFYAGSHWRIRRAEAARVHLLVLAALGGRLSPFAGPVNITVTAVYRAHLVDADNVCAKLYIDGLRGVGLLADDSPRWVASVTTRSVRAEIGACDAVVIEIQGVNA